MGTGEKDSSLIHSIVNRRSVGLDGSGGGEAPAWTEGPDSFGGVSRGRRRGVIREEVTYRRDLPRIETRVYWKRPSDGETLTIVCDVFGAIDPQTRTIPEGQIHSVHLMCPRCAPNGIGADGNLRVEASDMQIHLDDKNRLWLEHKMKCPWCFYKFRVDEGVLHDA